jgi:hypothetical protein
MRITLTIIVAIGYSLLFWYGAKKRIALTRVVTRRRRVALGEGGANAVDDEGTEDLQKGEEYWLSFPRRLIYIMTLVLAFGVIKWGLYRLAS